MTLRLIYPDPDKVASYRRMAALTGADLAEHMALFPDFAVWFAARKTISGGAMTDAITGGINTPKNF